MDTFLRMYNSRYDAHTFPYDRVVKIWRKNCQRRGLGNIFDQSGIASANKNATSTDLCNSTVSGSGSGWTSSSIVEIEMQSQSEDNIGDSEGNLVDSKEFDGFETKDVDDERMWKLYPI